MMYWNVNGRWQVMPQRERMIAQALRQHDWITPCGPHKRIEDCFTVLNRPGRATMIILWYNDPTGTTKIIAQPLEK